MKAKSDMQIRTSIEMNRRFVCPRIGMPSSSPVSLSGRDAAWVLVRDFGSLPGLLKQGGKVARQYGD